MSTPNHDLIQDAIVAHLQSREVIQNPPNTEQEHFVGQLVIPVHDNSNGDWMNEAAAKIKSIGLGIVVRKGLYALRGVFETYPFLVEIIEIPVLNRGQLGSQLTAQQAMRQWSKRFAIGPRLNGQGKQRTFR